MNKSNLYVNGNILKHYIYLPILGEIYKLKIKNTVDWKLYGRSPYILNIEKVLTLFYLFDINSIIFICGVYHAYKYCIKYHLQKIDLLNL